MTNISLPLADADEIVAMGEQSADWHNEHTGPMACELPDTYQTTGGDGRGAGGLPSIVRNVSGPRAPILEVCMDEMFTVDEFQAHLDGLTRVMTGMTAVWKDEKMTNGTLSDESQLALVALKLAAVETQLLLVELGVPLNTGEGAS